MIIHANASDDTVVEEFSVLKEKINKAMLSDYYSLLVSEEKIAPIIDANNLRVLQMKGCLFNLYSLIDDCDSYNNINERSLEHRNNIREAASAEDIALRNSKTGKILNIFEQPNKIKRFPGISYNTVSRIKNNSNIFYVQSDFDSLVWSLGLELVLCFIFL